ncbi:bifunctional methylenetetrahydrofolate dehydrogenase/methenyltetrahydrofolate cyclohydrolase, partial [Patescibacteria group bacterium]|nr:bifunctional methylenetetrahydrofolate dehydrogenase/methenyltetrahydrofolate cyclohydrolase [Patescibacteria group bacterium]
MAIIIDGNQLAKQLEAKLKIKTDGLKQKGVIPQLAVLVLAGDAAGEVYAGLKEKAAARLGIKFKKIALAEEIEKLNQDPAVHGIMVQRPGYKGEEFEKEWVQLVNTIVPSKDV